MGPRTCSLMQKGAVFHFTLHCCNTVLMTILFIIQCLLYEFVSYFSLFLPLKMSGPLGPHTYIQMQKGAVFHFTLHCCNTVLMTVLFIIQCLLYEFVLYFSLFTLFTFKNVRSTGPTYLNTNAEDGSVSFQITFNVYCMSLSYIFHFSLSLPLKMSGPLGPRTYIQMQKGAVFHFTLHSMFTVLVCLILFTFHFSLSLPLKMSGPLGPRTYIQMQKGAVFHFTLHSMFTV